MIVERLSVAEAVEQGKNRRTDWVDPELAAGVEQIRVQMAERGDDALVELTNALDSVEGSIETVAVDPADVAAAVGEIDQELAAALELAAANIRAVAEAGGQSVDTKVDLPQGHRVTIGRRPLASAGIYAPGGRASYPSSVLMAAIPARVAGVSRVVLATPPGRDGRITPVTLAAASLAGVDQVYSMGGAQAIFALAFGTDTVDPVDVIVGPGNRWVQEAKRQVFGKVALDSIAGPSDLTVVFGPDVDPELIALDLAAQAEHGADSLVVAVALGGADPGPVGEAAEALAPQGDPSTPCRLWLVEAEDVTRASAVVEAIAPEHLELFGAEAEALSDSIRNAGCIFVGELSGTAFGDYIAGSNHILPTDGSGRSFGPLSVSTFQRPTSRVTLTQQAVDRLAGPAAVIAEAEGFPLHGLSVLKRKSG